MTARIEFKNSHTNRNPIRVTAVVKTGDSFTPHKAAEGAPDLVLAPGQNGARRAESRYLLVEVLDEDYLNKPRVPDEDAAKAE